MREERIQEEKRIQEEERKLFDTSKDKHHGILYNPDRAYPPPPPPAPRIPKPPKPERPKIHALPPRPPPPKTPEEEAKFQKHSEAGKKGWAKRKEQERLARENPEEHAPPPPRKQTIKTAVRIQINNILSKLYSSKTPRKFTPTSQNEELEALGYNDDQVDDDDELIINYAPEPSIHNYAGKPPIKHLPTTQLSDKDGNPTIKIYSSTQNHNSSDPL
jgi:hypothetical protein